MYMCHMRAVDKEPHLPLETRPGATIAHARTHYPAAIIRTNINNNAAARAPSNSMRALVAPLVLACAFIVVSHVAF